MCLSGAINQFPLSCTTIAFFFFFLVYFIYVAFCRLVAMNVCADFIVAEQALAIVFLCFPRHLQKQFDVWTSTLTQTFLPSSQNNDIGVTGCGATHYSSSRADVSFFFFQRGGLNGVTWLGIYEKQRDWRNWSKCTTPAPPSWNICIDDFSPGGRRQEKLIVNKTFFFPRREAQQLHASFIHSRPVWRIFPPFSRWESLFISFICLSWL